MTDHRADLVGTWQLIGWQDQTDWDAEPLDPDEPELAFLDGACLDAPSEIDAASGLSLTIRADGRVEEDEEPDRDALTWCDSEGTLTNEPFTYDGCLVEHEGRTWFVPVEPPYGEVGPGEHRFGNGYDAFATNCLQVLPDGRLLRVQSATIEGYPHRFAYVYERGEPRTGDRPVRPRDLGAPALADGQRLDPGDSDAEIRAIFRDGCADLREGDEGVVLVVTGAGGSRSTNVVSLPRFDYGAPMEIMSADEALAKVGVAQLGVSANEKVGIIATYLPATEDLRVAGFTGRAARGLGNAMRRDGIADLTHELLGR